MTTPKATLTALAIATALTGCSQNERMMNPASDAIALAPASDMEFSRALAAGEPSSAALYVLAASGQILTVDAADPSRVVRRVRVRGLATAGARLLAIDVRPATGGLYALGSDSRVYLLDAASGQAQAVGTAAFATPLAGTAFGFDFNPTVDRIRIVSDQGQNLRVHPETGAVAAVDAALAYAETDANSGRTPRVVAAAYTNSDNDPATGTTLYDLDAGLDALVTQAPPNDGKLNTTGALGINAGELAGFDIALVGGQNVAYAVLKSDDEGTLDADSDFPATLVRIDLTTGAVSPIAKIRGAGPVIGLAASIGG